MFWLFDDAFGFSHHGDGVDRSGWAEKSGAAMRRENHAKIVLDDFLKSLSSDSTIRYPLSREVIPPSIHLTSACYTSFRKYVSSKGCLAVRREATSTELAALPKGERRRCKMYWIKITVPTDPSELQQAKAAQERQAKEQAAKRKADAERKRKLEQELQQTTESQYKMAMDYVTTATTSSSIKNTNADKENVDMKNNQLPSNKRAKTTTGSFVITVPSTRILAYHQDQWNKETNKIRTQNYKQKQEELRQFQQALDKKYADKERDEVLAAKHLYQIVKSAIVQATSSASSKAQ